MTLKFLVTLFLLFFHTSVNAQLSVAVGSEYSTFFRAFTIPPNEFFETDTQPGWALGVSYRLNLEENTPFYLGLDFASSNISLARGSSSRGGSISRRASYRLHNLTLVAYPEFGIGKYKSFYFSLGLFGSLNIATADITVQSRSSTPLGGSNDTFEAPQRSELNPFIFGPQLMIGYRLAFGERTAVGLEAYTRFSMYDLIPSDILGGQVRSLRVGLRIRGFRDELVVKPR